VATVLLALALVAGCTEGRDQARRSTTTSRSEIDRPAPATPEVGQCRGEITRQVIRGAVDDRRPISCDQLHGSETFFVDELPPEAADLSHPDAVALAVDSPVLRDVLDRCGEEFNHYVGVSRIDVEAVREHNLTRAFFIPHADDWARGARWIRCDVVTEPLNGVVARGTTERLRGLVARDPLPPEWRPCYRDVEPPPSVRFGFLVSCDRPHLGEALLRFLVTDPQVDAIAGDQRRLEEFAGDGFDQPCLERVAAHVGRPVADFAAGNDLRVAALPLDMGRWATDHAARWVQCLAFTSRPRVGTLEGLGTKPATAA
jgi:hypothetical protein